MSNATHNPAQVAELTGELNARKVDCADLAKRCGELRAACDALKLHIDQQTNAGIELRRAVRALLDQCDRGLFELPCGHYNELRAALA